MKMNHCDSFILDIEDIKLLIISDVIGSQVIFAGTQINLL